MSPETRELMMRVAASVRAECVTAARGRADIDARAGRHEAASYQNGAANALSNVDIEKVVDAVGAKPAQLDERIAFAIAARIFDFNTTENAAGDFLHPITRRAFSIWRAAATWARLPSHQQRSPVP